MQTVMHIRFIRPFPGTLAVIGIWLTIGTLGYHYLQSLPWLDALLNASMILSGMGPVNIPETTAGKWFSAFYALFSGVVFITIIGLLITPVLNRLLQGFHLKEFASAESSSDNIE